MWASFSGQTSQIIFFFNVHDECSLKLYCNLFFFTVVNINIIMINIKQPWLVKVPGPHSLWNLQILVGPCSIILGYSEWQSCWLQYHSCLHTEPRTQGLVRLQTSSTCSKVLSGYIHGVGGCLSPMYIYKEKGSPQNSYIIRHKKRIWKCFGDGYIMLYRWTYMNLHELETW